jgi:hypothetical protein
LPGWAAAPPEPTWVQPPPTTASSFVVLFSDMVFVSIFVPIDDSVVWPKLVQITRNGASRVFVLQICIGAGVFHIDLVLRENGQSLATFPRLATYSGRKKK